MRLGQRHDSLRLLQGGADVQGTMHACGTHACEHLTGLLNQPWIVEMTMGIDQHHEKALR